MNEDKKFWFEYTYKKIKSANRLVNFVVGARGCGKTFAVKKDAVENFLKDGSQFVYMRRYDKELTDIKARELFFPLALKEIFPEHELTYRNGVYMIDGKTAGFPMSLSTSSELKSIEYDKVKTIAFDEFIRIEGNGYLNEEVKLFNEALITVSRLRDPQFFLLSNNVSWQNPYFIRYKIPRPDPEKETIYGKTWSLTLPRSEKYKKVVAESPVGRFLQEVDPDHFEYAFGNVTYEDNTDFVEEIPKGARYMFTLNIMSSFGVWFKDGIYYIGRKTDPGALIRLDLDPGRFKKGAKLQRRKGGIIDRFITSIYADRIRYEDVDIKNELLLTVRMI